MRDLQRFPTADGSVLIHAMAVMAIWQQTREINTCHVVLFGGPTYQIVNHSSHEVAKKLGMVEE